MKRNSLLLLLISFSIISFGQNGKLLSKKLIPISQTPIWNKISINDTLKTSFKYLNKLDFYFITYESDSLKIKGIAIEQKIDDKYPVIIYNRGGNRTYGKITVAQMLLQTSRLAEKGYFIIGSNYRENDEFGGEEINDVLNLTKTIQYFDKADTTRIGMFGWSRGGMMTYLALKKSNKIKTAIIGNGPSNLFNSVDFRPIMEEKVYSECIPNYWENKNTELKKRSAIYWTDELNKNSSLLILSGTKDKKVNPKQAVTLSKKLSEINYDYKLMEYETDHSFSDKRKELNNIIINWFNENLKNR